VAAGYSGGEADQLRRSMAAWKRHGDIEKHRARITQGMLARGYTPEFSAELFDRLKGFGSYGFPESHAVSFALLAYASAWLKCHEPAAFVCALLNSLPMGFYSESQLVQDARRHGIRVLPVDVRASDWDSTLETDADADAPWQPALRLGLRLVRGFDEAAAVRIGHARAAQAFANLADLVERAGLDARERRLLVDAGALRGLAGHRHRARWQVAGIEPQRPLFGRASPDEASIVIAPPATGENTLADYAATGLTLGVHPVRQVRAQLRARRCQDPRNLRALPHGAAVRAAGLVTLRQRPATASGVTFVTLEDEAGTVNVVVWRDLAERQRRVLLQARLLGVDGHWESVAGVQHLVAQRLHDYSALLGALDSRSRDFH
jgi:error-prone DNA polymerase